MERYLDSIASFLHDNPVKLSENDADGRVNSGINEHEILDFLKESIYGTIINLPPPRCWYDFAIKTNEGEMFVNIKVSDLSNSAADNLSSKQGMGYALTGIKTIPNDVFWTSLKRIEKLQANGNNLPFQCNWSANRKWSQRTEEEAIEYILSVYIDSWNKKISGYPGEIKAMLERGEIHSKKHYGRAV